MNKDMSWKLFFKDNERFADFINCIVLGGTGQIPEKNIVKVDSQLSG